MNQAAKRDWVEYSNQNTIDAYKAFLLLYPSSLYTEQANQEIAKLEEKNRLEQEKDQSDYNFAKEKHTIRSYDDYLQNHSVGLFRKNAFNSLFNLIEENSDKENLFLTYYEKYPNGIQFIPIDYRLQIIGPKNLKIKNLKEHLANGIGSQILISKIKRVTTGYKNFDLEEISKLKEWKFSDNLISTMMDITFAIEKEEKEKIEKEGLKAEISRLTALVEKLQASQASEQSNEPIGYDKQGNPIYDAIADKGKDVVKDCAKKLAERLVKVQACGQLPWPASTICENTLESDNSCPR